MEDVISHLLVWHQIHEQEHLFETGIRINKYNIGKTFHLVLPTDSCCDSLFKDSFRQTTNMRRCLGVANFLPFILLSEARPALIITAALTAPFNSVDD